MAPWQQPILFVGLLGQVGVSGAGCREQCANDLVLFPTWEVLQMLSQSFRMIIDPSTQCCPTVPNRAGLESNRRKGPSPIVRSCNVCSFKNIGLLPYCEVCEAGCMPF